MVSVLYNVSAQMGMPLPTAVSPDQVASIPQNFYLPADAIVTSHLMVAVTVALAVAGVVYLAGAAYKARRSQMFGGN